MDAQNQNQGGKELAERIKANLAETQHRYELHDPFAETTFRFQTAEAATAKADELGASRFQHRDADGSVKQVDKVDGQWWVRNEPLPPQNSQQAPAQDDKPLASVQEAIDRDSLRAIEARAEQLRRGAAPATAAGIAAALVRLTAPTQMGTLFKAMAVTHPAWPVPAGFAA